MEVIDAGAAVRESAGQLPGNAAKYLGVRCSEANRQKPVYDFFKRFFDILFSSIALILFLPIFIITAAAIKIEDGGSILYTQTRVGISGKFFKIYKFRSMCENASEMKQALMSQNESDGPTFKIANDPRVTKVGAIIRKYSIDELPQLWNIIKGDMSIVGPRPPLGYEVMEYDEFAMRRLTVKPGLTCYWQCSGRSNLSFDEWMQLDNKYIDERSLWTDIKIIFKTIPAVLNSNGAC